MIVRVLLEAVEAEIFELLSLGAGEDMQRDAAIVELRELADIGPLRPFKRRPDGGDDIVGQDAVFHADAHVAGLEILGQGIVGRYRHPVVPRDVAIHRSSLAAQPRHPKGRYTLAPDRTIPAGRGPPSEPPSVRNPGRPGRRPDLQSNGPLRTSPKPEFMIRPEMTLETLIDERAIEQVYHRYCDIIDQKDFDRLVEVFTADCVGDYRNTNGKIQEGVAPLIAHLWRGMGPGADCGETHHNVCNFRIVVDGDTAGGKAHFYAVHRGVNHYDGQMYTCWGEYDDAWVRTVDGWRVNRRTYRNFLIEGPVAIVRGTHRIP